MGEGAKPLTPLIVEVDHENTHKDVDKLAIEISILSPRIYRDYKDLPKLAPHCFGHKNEEGFTRYKPKSFGSLTQSFLQYKT